MTEIELKELLEKLRKDEVEKIKIQSKIDTLIENLKKEYDISVDDLDTEIEKLKLIIQEETRKLEISMEKLNEY